MLIENEKLPIGTRIQFLKTLEDDPFNDMPGNLYAREGDKGIVVGHNCAEGHLVTWDKGTHEFGAELGTEFKRI